MIVDCMACLVNATGLDSWPHGTGGPRRPDESSTTSTDEHGVCHAFVRTVNTCYRGWWKCDFTWDHNGWIREWNCAWDP